MHGSQLIRMEYVGAEHADDFVFRFAGCMYEINSVNSIAHNKSRLASIEHEICHNTSDNFLRRNRTSSSRIDI